MGHLHVRNLGKAYKRYRHKWGRLAEWAGMGVQHELAWVLRDVSFDVNSGEAIGLVGANGAGKSTLLKLLSRTVRPTTGSFETAGRVAALLELGIGFHPEFTGRQNCYMAAHLLGIPAHRIASLVEEVHAFAEIGDYMDRPVRTYSSGMQVRLAFSVATSVRPDILIVDEALSVGDTYFQHKSFDRIRRYRDEGTTLLFVSHNPAAVKTLCDRALLLDGGILLRDDSPEAVLDYYNAMIAAQRANYAISQTELETGQIVTRSGTAEARIDSVKMLVAGQATNVLCSGDAAVFRVDLVALADLPELTVGILIRDRLGNDVFGTNTFHLNASRRNVRSGTRLAVDFRFSALSLGTGSFSVAVALHTRDTHVARNFDWWDRAIVFQVVRGSHAMATGVCMFPVEVDWNTGGLSGTPTPAMVQAVNEQTSKPVLLDTPATDATTGMNEHI